MIKILRIASKSDILLIIFLLIISLLLLLNSKKDKPEKLVRIYYQNKLWGTYPITKNRILTLSDDIKIQIRDNKVRMLENNCKRQLCVKQGWSESQPIICVPNKILIEICRKSKNKILISY
jgi:hypothetical protein